MTHKELIDALLREAENCDKTSGEAQSGYAEAFRAIAIMLRSLVDELRVK